MKYLNNPWGMREEISCTVKCGLSEDGGKARECFIVKFITEHLSGEGLFVQPQGVLLIKVLANLLFLSSTDL